MRLKFYYFLLAAAVTAVGCNVDENYDLSTVSTDNITIGNDDSAFELPVATITLTSEDFDGYVASASADVATLEATRASLTDASFSELLTLVDAFLPSTSTIDIAAITADDNTDAVNSLIEELITELQNDEEKCLAFSEVLYDYADDFESTIYESLGISSSDLTVESINEALKETLEDEEKISEFKEAAVTTVNTNVIDDLKKYSEMDIDQELGSIEIPEDVVDILKENIDGVISTLKIVATYEHNFPFSFTLSEIDLINSQTISFNIVANGEDVVPTVIDIDELIDVLESGDGAKLFAALKLDTYSAVETTDDNYLKIKISVIKTGAISF